MKDGPRERDRPYDTTEPDTLGSVLSRLFASRGYGRAQGDRQLHAAWSQIAGEDISRQTKVIVLRNGILQIGVANAALLNELVSFQKPELLQKLRTEFPEFRVRDIKFKHRGDLLFKD
jgi:predicted nucleic acid-binding Zn ribbon protein